MMKENPRISITQLSKIIGMTRNNTDRNIQKLKEKGYLERIESTKTGYWRIVNK